METGARLGSCTEVQVARDRIVCADVFISRGADDGVQRVQPWNAGPVSHIHSAGQRLYACRYGKDCRDRTDWRVLRRTLLWSALGENWEAEGNRHLRVAID